MNRLIPVALLACAALTAACGGCPDDFMRACAKKGCAEKVKAALAKDASLATTPGAKGVTPLHVAADGEIAEALIAAGADPNAQSSVPSWPLGTATARDAGDVVKVLLARGVKVADPAYEASRAMRDGRLAVLEVYLDSGVAPHEGMLLDAVINDLVGAAEILLKRGVSAKATMGADMKVFTIGGQPTGKGPEDVSGKTALELAKSDAMRELLKKHGG